MLAYRILCVGRRAQDPLLAVADNYAKRLNAYVRTQRVVVRQSDRAQEGQAIVNQLRKSEFNVALDERGRSLTTAALAALLDAWQREGRRDITFIVGGADGLDPGVLVHTQQTLSLSPMTLPHRLAQVVLLEQLYRAHTILRGEKYHK